MLEKCTMCSLCNNLLAKRDNEKKVRQNYELLFMKMVTTEPKISEANMLAFNVLLFL